MINILYAVWESIWRRMFGSDGWNLPIIKYRAVQHVFNVLATFGVLWYIGISWWQNAIVCAIYEGFYWSRSHGDYYAVLDKSKDEARIKWIDYVLKKIYGEGNYYNFKGNATGLFIRYETPSIFISIISMNYWFLLAGIFVVASYCVCGLLFPKKNYTDYAEYLSGFFSGLLLTL